MGADQVVFSVEKCCIKVWYFPCELAESFRAKGIYHDTIEDYMKVTETMHVGQTIRTAKIVSSWRQWQEALLGLMILKFVCLHNSNFGS